MARTSIPASPDTYTAGRMGRAVTYIVVHYTGGAGTARENGRYFAGGDRGASAHVFIDDNDVVESVPEGDTAWACGNFEMNLRSVSVEVCSDGEDFSEAEIALLAAEVRRLMTRYGVPAENVIRHRDCYAFGVRDGLGGGWVDPGKACPAPYVDDDKWFALWCRVTGADGAAAPVAPAADDAAAAVRYMQGLAAPMCERAGFEPPQAGGSWDEPTQRALVRLAQVQMMACMDPTLTPSGWAGGQSRAVMDARPVSRGDSGLAAWAAKAALVGRGYGGAEVGGAWSGVDLGSWEFDAVAEAALRRFQADNPPLAASGRADAATWCTLCPNTYSDDPNR